MGSIWKNVDALRRQRASQNCGGEPVDNDLADLFLIEDAASGDRIESALHPRRVHPRRLAAHSLLKDRYNAEPGGAGRLRTGDDQIMSSNAAGAWL
jgi:hypothetical protein